MHVALTEGQVDVTLCGWCVCTCPINLSVPIKLYLLKYRPFLAIRRRQWHPTPIFLPRKSHGRRSLVGCSPWGRWGSDMTEWLHFHFLLSCIGEGNGNPLQYSCLENPRDGRAWWAAVYAVSQSRTRLKWLSSSRILYGDWINRRLKMGIKHKTVASLSDVDICLLWVFEGSGWLLW